MQSSLPFQHSQKAFLAKGDDADPGANWTWRDTDQKVWKLVPDNNENQQFYGYWRSRSDGSDFLKSFPYLLPSDPQGPPLPFRPGKTLGNRIVVTKGYDLLLHRLLTLRAGDVGQAQGVLITGQPGTGKATFLNFMLAQLISAKQVVVTCTDSFIHLFYGGKVYARRTGTGGFRNLPQHKSRGYWPIWALIDVTHEPPLEKNHELWPIQASPPDPVRFYTWFHRYKATKLGMPKWTEEELTMGLSLQPRYGKFQEKFGQVLELFAASGKVDTVLSLLQSEKEKVEFGAVLELLLVVWQGEEEEQEEEREEMEREEMEREEMERGGEGDLDKTRSSADQDEDHTADKLGRSQALDPQKALETLVQNITQRFGFAPRDVYNGIFKFSATKKMHADAVAKFDPNDLPVVSVMFSTETHIEVDTNIIIAVYPQDNSLDDWSIDFKSIWVSRDAMFSMLQGGRRLRQGTVNFFSQPQASSASSAAFNAGRMYERTNMPDFF